MRLRGLHNRQTWPWKEGRTDGWMDKFMEGRVGMGGDVQCLTAGWEPQEDLVEIAGPFFKQKQRERGQFTCIQKCFVCYVQVQLLHVGEIDH